jgi:hypothetical protein
MAEPGQQIDRYWEDVMNLSERLTASAWRLFRDRGCSSVESMLPGTGMCALDLVAKTIWDLIDHGQWTPGSGEDIYPVAYKALKRDFLDLIKSAEHRTTEISESIEDEHRDRLTAEAIPQGTEGALLVNSLRPYLKNDPEALEFLEVLLVKGFEAHPDIADEMGVTVQDVINIKRRLRLKNRLWIRLGLLDPQ